MTIKLNIEGMSCKNCVKHVKEALEAQGFENVNVSLEEKSACFEANALPVQSELHEMLDDLGYELVGMEQK